MSRSTRVCFALAAAVLLIGVFASAPAHAIPKCPCDPTCTCTVGTGGPDLINGTGSCDNICGVYGNDVINGGGGDDVLLGGPGDDEIDGGAGYDIIDGGLHTDVCTNGEMVSNCELP